MLNYHYDLPEGVIASNIAHLYRRVSESRQLLGTGLDRQLDTTQQYLADYELELKGSYMDRGFSAYRGANRRHGELGNIMRAIKAGIIAPGEHLVIESVDRLSREPPFEALETMKRILEKGIIVHTVLDRRIYTYRSVNSDLSQLLVMFISMSRANEESRIKGSRVASAWADKRKDSEVLTAKGPGWLAVVDKKSLKDPREIEHARRFSGDRAFTVDPHRLGLVQSMFEQVANGISPHKVAVLLNEEGEKPWGHQRKNAPRIHRWVATTVIHIITSKAVLGEYRSHTTHWDAEGTRRLKEALVKPDYYMPVISADLWMRANEAIRKRKQAKVRGNTGKKFPNLFHGLVRCFHCGGPMHYKTTGQPSASNPYRKSYQFFRCAARGENMCENSTTKRADVFENVFLEWVTEVELEDRRGEDVRQIEQRTAEQTLRIENLNAEIDRVMNGYSDTKRGKVRVMEMEAEIEAIETAVKSDRHALAVSQTSQSPQDRSQALSGLIDLMNTVAPEDLYETRASLHYQIRETVSEIWFRKTGRVDVVLVDGKRYVWLAPEQISYRTPPDRFSKAVSLIPWVLEASVRSDLVMTGLDGEFFAVTVRQEDLPHAQAILAAGGSEPLYSVTFGEYVVLTLADMDDAVRVKMGCGILQPEKM